MNEPLGSVYSLRTFFLGFWPHYRGCSVCVHLWLIPRLTCDVFQHTKHSKDRGRRLQVVGLMTWLGLAEDLSTWRLETLPIDDQKCPPLMAPIRSTAFSIVFASEEYHNPLETARRLFRTAFFDDKSDPTRKVWIAPPLPLSSQPSTQRVERISILCVATFLVFYLIFMIFHCCVRRKAQKKKKWVKCEEEKRISRLLCKLNKAQKGSTVALFPPFPLRPPTSDWKANV